MFGKTESGSKARGCVSIKRKLLKALAGFLVIASAGAFQATAALLISEFVAQNDGGLRDADGDSPDWIEIQNDSVTPVSLAGWHLTDSPTNLVKWTFPATNLPAGGFLVVFAS